MGVDDGEEEKLELFEEEEKAEPKLPGEGVPGIMVSIDEGVGGGLNPLSSRWQPPNSIEKISPQRGQDLGVLNPP